MTYDKPEIMLVGHAAALVLGAKTSGHGDTGNSSTMTNHKTEMELGLDD
jgi:hypothetical protein